MAVLQLNQDKNATAEKAIGLALELTPGDPYARTVYAEVLLKKGDTSGAVENAQEVLVNRPDNHEALLVMAVAKLHQGKIPEAEKAVKLSLKSNPGILHTRVVYAGILLLKGDAQSAEKTIKEVLQACPGNNEAAIVRAAIFIGDKNNRRAAEILHELGIYPFSFQLNNKIRGLLSGLLPGKENIPHIKSCLTLATKLLYGRRASDCPLAESDLKNISFTEHTLAELACEFRYLEKRCSCSPGATQLGLLRARRLLIDKFSERTSRLYPRIKRSVVHSWLVGSYIWSSTERTSLPLEKARLAMKQRIPDAWTIMLPIQQQHIKKMTLAGSIIVDKSGRITLYRAVYGSWAAALSRRLKEQKRLTVEETASAWTSDLQVAVDMAGLVGGGRTALILQAQVPVSAVISSYLTNPALPYKDREFIINTFKSEFRYANETFVHTYRGKTRKLSIELISP